MTDTALTAIDRFSWSAGGCIGSQAPCPCHFIGIDVDDPGLRIDSRTTPFGSAIESRKYDGLLIESKWNEQSFTAECAELIDCPSVCFRGSIRQDVFGQQLSGIRSWLERSRLRRRSQLPRNRAGRILLFFDRKQ